MTRRLAGISSVSPEFGFRPLRAEDTYVVKVPKSVKGTALPSTSDLKQEATHEKNGKKHGSVNQSIDREAQAYIVVSLTSEMVLRIVSKTAFASTFERP